MFSYGGDASGSELDQVRFLLADTTEDGALISDEDIEFWLARTRSVYNDPIMAAAVCADLIAGRYAGEVSINADGVSYSGEQLQAKYTQLATTLRMTYKILRGVGGGPDVGGIGFDERPEPGVRPGAFGSGLHDNPRAGGQDYPVPGGIRELWPDDGGLVTGP